MRKYLTAFLGFMISICSRGQVKIAKNEIQHSKAKITQEQSELIFSNIKSFPNNTELSIAFIENGNVNFIGVKRSNDAFEIHKNHYSIFEIGSLSKVFTATLLSNFVVNDKIGLEDNIQDYLDFKIKVDNPITFKELANHTSGLPRLPTNLNLLLVDPNNPYKDYDEEKLTEYLTKKATLNKKAKTKYEYSNLGAGLLGFGLSKIAHQTYEELLQENIFEKYGMLNSTCNPMNIECVKGRKPNGEIASNWDFNVLAGAGAILSTVDDLSKFALAQFNKKNEELTLTQKPTFKVNENISIGLGWHILKRKNDKELIWHNGGTGGYTSSMALDLNKNIGIIISSNVSAFNPKMGNIDKLCFGLIDMLNEK